MSGMGLSEEQDLSAYPWLVTGCGHDLSKAPFLTGRWQVLPEGQYFPVTITGDFPGKSSGGCGGSKVTLGRSPSVASD